MVAFVQAQQHVLRHRSEEVLADIQAINLRQSTFEQANQFRQKWAKWIASTGDCASEHCDFYVRFLDFSARHYSQFQRPSLRLAYHLFGGRQTIVYAGISVRNGIVWQKSFGVGFYDYLGREPELLEARADTVPGIDQTLSVTHPEYSMNRAFPGIVWLLRFTPYVAKSDLDRLMQFDLTCISRRRACLSPGEIMPAAWQQSVGEEDAPMPDRCSQQIAELRVRDAEDVIIVNVVRNQTRVDSKIGTYHAILLTLEASLKRRTSWIPGTSRNMLPSSSSVSNTLVPGTRWIMLLTHDGFINDRQVSIPD
jgi:hypothetical protein